MIHRRTLLSGAAALAAAATVAPAARAQEQTPYVIPEEHMPRLVRIKGAVQPNEIHVDPDAFALYWTLPEGKAIRYAVGIGREGLYEWGSFYVGAKKEWPEWTPTPEMIARDPASYERWKDGMPGGPDNPLGARALYLFTAEGGDSFLRIHGTNAPRTIGTRVSNGCARLVNSHAVHLYDQVPLGARVYLGKPSGEAELG
ncbi:L,D-transpeptidase [Palleronia sp. KMU-117]|uniref:L,D-transpeptidase n=1 Tax=Palleronia sp. KMU-117 TaxID=3434108 RepID=UPI003D7572D4